MHWRDVSIVIDVRERVLSLTLQVEFYKVQDVYGDINGCLTLICERELERSELQRNYI